MGVIQTFEDEFAVSGPNPNEASLRERGWMDQVTDLPNQAMMQSHLRESLGTFGEMQVPFGILILEAHDLGKFRARYGHEAGSMMLRVLARTLRNTIWQTDFVGRWGEERFLVILAGCGERQLYTATERVVRMMASATIEWWGQELSLAVSTGLARAENGDDVESILQRAMQGLTKGLLSARGVEEEDNGAGGPAG
jgi:diguanylate cyclase (GGDEF)-like protein